MTIGKGPRMTETRQDHRGSRRSRGRSPTTIWSSFEDDPAVMPLDGDPRGRCGSPQGRMGIRRRPPMMRLRSALLRNDLGLASGQRRSYHVTAVRIEPKSFELAEVDPQSQLALGPSDAEREGQLRRSARAP